MSVVNLVILLESVACALALEDWVVEDVEAQVPDTAEAQVMGAVIGATVRIVGLRGVAAAILLPVAGATVDHHHIAVKTLLMLMGIDVGAGAEVCCAPL